MAGSRLGSRRGSAAAGRSRAGSISLGGVERRGSYYGEDVSKRSTVAVVVDDPDGKKNMEKQLEAVFNGNGKSINTLLFGAYYKTGSLIFLEAKSPSGRTNLDGSLIFFL